MAKRLLEDARAQAGEHARGDVGSTMRIAQDEQIVKLKEAQISVQNHFREGERCFHDEDYDNAVDEFTYVVEAEKWFPYNVDVSGLVRQARDYLERSKELAQVKARGNERKMGSWILELSKQEEMKRKDMVIGKIKGLFGDAQKEFEAERYERAELLCAQLLKIDPSNSLAPELYLIARAAKHAQRDRRDLSTYRREWMRQFESIDIRTIPYEDIVYASDCEWPPRCGQAQAVDNGAGEAGMAPEDLEIANRMKSQNISLNFSETPLPEVISWLREFTNLNIVLTGVENPAEIKVTFRVDNLPFDQAFDLILRMWELGYQVEQGVIVVTTRSKLETETVFEMYRVQNLTAYTSYGFPDPEINLTPPLEDTPTGGAAPPPPAGTDELIELIKRNIAKGTWDTAPNSIEINNGLLIVRHTPFVQRQIQTLLQDLRRSGGLPNQTRPELVTYDVRDLLKPGAPDVFPKAETAESLIEKVRAQVGTETWTDASRSLTLSRGFLLVRAETWVQEKVLALIESLRPKYYIRDYDVEIAEQFTYIQDWDEDGPAFVPVEPEPRR